MYLYPDLALLQEVRDKVDAASKAQLILSAKSQSEIDSIVYHLALKGEKKALLLAQMAVQETGFGVIEDKVTKNLFATKVLWEYIKNLKTVGFIDKIESVKDGVFRVASPVGVIAGIIPSTNPTSTSLFKMLISIKAGNSIVLSPHPRSVNCTMKAVEIFREGLEEKGFPPDLVQCLSASTLQATEALMKHDKISLILATGGLGLVKAAYTSGKPSYGVGPGNVPVFIERSADIKKAVRDILKSKTFDNGTICASEQAIVVEDVIKNEVREEFISQGAYFLKRDEIKPFANLLFPDNQHVNPLLVGQPASKIAEYAGINVVESTRVLIAELDAISSDCPLYREKLSPVLAWFTCKDWEEGCQICLSLLSIGGQGHTLAIHSRNKEVIRAFALYKPVSRILVNTPSSHGAIGYSTGLAPSLTLGCGTLGGNITSDNITPLHLINIKRLSFETNKVI